MIYGWLSTRGVGRRKTWCLRMGVRCRGMRWWCGRVRFVVVEMVDRRKGRLNSVERLDLNELHASRRRMLTHATTLSPLTPPSPLTTPLSPLVQWEFSRASSLPSLPKGTRRPRRRRLRCWASAWARGWSPWRRRGWVGRVRRVRMRSGRAVRRVCWGC